MSETGQIDTFSRNFLYLSWQFPVKHNNKLHTDCTSTNLLQIDSKNWLIEFQHFMTHKKILNKQIEINTIVLYFQKFNIHSSG